MLAKDIEKVLITREDIQKRCVELGVQLTADYTDKNPLVVGILKGAYLLWLTIVREIDARFRIGFYGCFKITGIRQFLRAR